MSRTLLRFGVKDDAGNAIQNALLFFYLEGTTSPVLDAWSAKTGGTSVTTVLTDPTGQVEVWFETPKNVDVKITDNSGTAVLVDTGAIANWPDFTKTVPVTPNPADIALTTTVQTFAADVRFSTRPWVDVNGFPGVDPTGVLDSTVGLQAAIDAAIGAGSLASRGTPAVVAIAKYNLRFDGKYKTTAPLFFRSVRSLLVDFCWSIFQPSGTFDAVLDFDGCTWSRFSNAVFANGTGTQDKLIHYHWDSTKSANSSSGCTFENFVSYQTITSRIGFGIGVTSTDAAHSQVDGSMFTNIILAGGWTGTIDNQGAVDSGNTTTFQAGFWIGDGTYGNNIDHVFINCAPVGWAKGFYGNAVNMWVFGSQIGSNGCDFFIPAAGAVHISGVRSEHSHRAICTAGSSGSSACTVSNYHFVGVDLDSDGYVICWQMSGSLTLSSFSVDNVPGGTTAKFFLVGYSHLTVTMLGVSMPTAFASAFTKQTGESSVTLIASPYVQFDPGTSNVIATTVRNDQPVVVESTQTGNYTLIFADIGTTVAMNVAGANTLTIPPNSSVAFPIGTVIDVYQMGAGQTTLTAGAGVTINSEGGKLKLAAQHAVARLRKRATDTWIAEGNLVV